MRASWRSTSIERPPTSIREDGGAAAAAAFAAASCSARRNVPFTRAQLLDQVWGYSHSGYEHTVNSHINRLRNKIERDPANPDFIQTVWGVGYRFAELRG